MTAVTVHFCTGVKRRFFSLCSSYLLIFFLNSCRSIGAENLKIFTWTDFRAATLNAFLSSQFYEHRPRKRERRLFTAQLAMMIACGVKNGSSTHHKNPSLKAASLAC